MIVAGELLM